MQKSGFFCKLGVELDGGWLLLPTRWQQYCDLSLVLVYLSVYVGGGVDVGWMLLPTCPQQYFGKVAQW